MWGPGHSPLIYVLTSLRLSFNWSGSVIGLDSTGLAPRVWGGGFPFVEKGPIREQNIVGARRLPGD